MISFNRDEIGLPVWSEVLACIDGHQIGEVGVHFGLGYVDEIYDLGSRRVGVLLEVTVKVGQVVFFGGVGEEGADVLEIAFLDIDDYGDYGSGNYLLLLE